MAIGLDPPTNMESINGIELASVAAGIRFRDRDDLVLISIPETASTAAVFTRNRYRAAPVQVAKRHLAAARPRALLINAGNANAGTGAAGLDDALKSCELVAKALQLPVDSVLPFSTGVIGERLPMDAVAAGITHAAGCLAADGWLAAANAIMTTDTMPKVISRKVETVAGSVTLTGMVKGSGMIRPDMATLLAFVAMDSRIDSLILQNMLRAAVDVSFNRITVDGDTSTNDACVLISNGRPGAVQIESADTPAYTAVADALSDLMLELAQMVIRDGEGVTKYVEVRVNGAADESDCREVAYTVAHSPLVKTALFASDPNWGRILAAVGRAPVPELEMEKVALTINGIRVVSDGELAPDYTEARGKAALARGELLIEISLGSSDTSFTVWTTDLSHDYVSINADYRS
jgi:glutamate N-acetyltransferase/amino-acid N-acetyltransferase